MQNTEDVPARMRLEVIYVLLHLHDFVVILSYQERKQVCPDSRALSER